MDRPQEERRAVPQRRSARRAGMGLPRRESTAGEDSHSPTLEEGSDRMARELLGIAASAESESVRLQAIRDALDRAGLSAKTAVEVDVALKPHEQMAFDVIGGGTRAESRARRGIADNQPSTADRGDDHTLDLSPRGKAAEWMIPMAGDMTHGDGEVSQL
jgi:hypothetical protein